MTLQSAVSEFHGHGASSRVCVIPPRRPDCRQRALSQSSAARQCCRRPRVPRRACSWQRVQNMPPRTHVELQRSYRGAAAVACRVSRPVKSPETPAGALRRRKKGRGSPASVAAAAPAALAPLFPASAPAQVAAVDYSARPCSCCGCGFGPGGTWFAARGDAPRDWDLCVRCLWTLVGVCIHLNGARLRALAHSLDAAARACAHRVPALLRCSCLPPLRSQRLPAEAQTRRVTVTAVLWRRPGGRTCP